MITDTTIVYGTDRDPRFTIRAGATLIHATEDNVDKIMTDLEQSKKSSSQLKDTLRKEREENNKLKRKYEDVQKDMRSSKMNCRFSKQKIGLWKLHKSVWRECSKSITS